jgi:hypothetical protein
MSSQDTSSSDTLALVNHFMVLAGAKACWYLSDLPLFPSIVDSSEKRKSDVVTSDFITLVTFPTVASAHPITGFKVSVSVICQPRNFAAASDVHLRLTHHH